MADVVIWLIIGIIGIFVGGGIGEVSYGEFSPYCWYGLCIVWGLPIVGTAGGELCD
jgi:hypothetical protein